MYVFFAYQYICSEKPVFVSTFLPFCPVSYWSQLVYGCVRVETRFYLFHGTRSLREVLGRYAPVMAAAVLTLNTIDNIGPCHEVRIQNIYIETPHHVVVNFFNNTIQAEK